MLLLCPSFAIQRQILFVALERVHAGNIVQNALVADNMRGRHVVPPVDNKLDFLGRLNTHSGVNLSAGQLPEIRP